MIRGLYTAAAGMIPRMSQMDNVAENLANSVTNGYKKSEVFLRTLIDAQYALDHALGGQWSNRPEEVWTDHTQGSFEPTGNPLDVALNGRGFFRVQDAAGIEYYTRDGRFQVDPNGYLINHQGMYVLNERSLPINIDGNVIRIAPDGAIFVDDAEEDRFGLADVANADYQALQRLGSGLFQRPAAVNPVPAAVETTFMQGYLEDSNVEPLETMVDMIQLFREYELGQRSIQMQDQSLQRLVTEVGSVR